MTGTTSEIAKKLAQQLVKSESNDDIKIQSASAVDGPLPLDFKNIVKTFFNKKEIPTKTNYDEFFTLFINTVINKYNETSKRKLTNTEYKNLLKSLNEEELINYFQAVIQTYFTAEEMRTLLLATIKYRDNKKLIAGIEKALENSNSPLTRAEKTRYQQFKTLMNKEQTQHQPAKNERLKRAVELNNYDSVLFWLNAGAQANGRVEIQETPEVKVSTTPLTLVQVQLERLNAEINGEYGKFAEIPSSTFKFTLNLFYAKNDEEYSLANYKIPALVKVGENEGDVSFYLIGAENNEKQKVRILEDETLCNQFKKINFNQNPELNLSMDENFNLLQYIRNIKVHAPINNIDEYSWSASKGNRDWEDIQQERIEKRDNLQKIYSVLKLYNYRDERTANTSDYYLPARLVNALRNKIGIFQEAQTFSRGDKLAAVKVVLNMVNKIETQPLTQKQLAALNDGALSVIVQDVIRQHPENEALAKLELQLGAWKLLSEAIANKKPGLNTQLIDKLKNAITDNNISKLNFKQLSDFSKLWKKVINAPEDQLNIYTDAFTETLGKFIENGRKGNCKIIFNTEIVTNQPEDDSGDETGRHTTDVRKF